VLLVRVTGGGSWFAAGIPFLVPPSPPLPHPPSPK
jgi:hypothetical protein